MQRRATVPKPAHLSPRYGAQFQDACVAAAYSTRPPYPAEFFDIINELHAPGPRRLVELGCGTGDATLGLARGVERVDAIEPSAAMLAVARQRDEAGDTRINWVHAAAEPADFPGRPYSLAVAAESLHWMEWSTVLPKVAAALAPGAVLALAERGVTGPMPWDAELTRLIRRYSTNQEFRPYDLVEELTSRGLFREAGRRMTAAVPFVQSVDAHVESMHSRNGFSRHRMDEAAAKGFDHLFSGLLKRHYPDGIVRLRTVTTVIWGHPCAE